MTHSRRCPSSTLIPGLLDLSGQVGQWRLAATLEQQDVHDRPHVQRWRITVDPATITGPPLTEEWYEPMPLEGSWGDGAARLALHQEADFTITRMDLTLDAEAARAFLSN